MYWISVRFYEMGDMWNRIILQVFLDPIAHKTPYKTIREDTHKKKCVFFSGRTTNRLVVHATIYLSLRAQVAVGTFFMKSLLHQNIK